MKKSLMLFIFVSIFLLTFSSVSATGFDTSIIKWTMCDQFNLTRWDCDNWWETPENPYYLGGNSGDSLNITYVKSELSKDYFNESEVLLLLTSVETNNSFNKSNFYDVIEVAKKLNDLKLEILVNLTDRFVEKNDLEYELRTTKSDGSLSDISLVVIFLLIAGGVIGFMYWNNKQSEKPDYNGKFGTVGISKLHKKKSVKEQQLEKELADAKKKLEENQAQKFEAKLKTNNNIVDGSNY